MTDRAYVTLISAVLILVVSLITAGVWSAEVDACDEQHGVVVSSSSGFGWDCRVGKR
jgi:hypothetical protein